MIVFEFFADLLLVPDSWVLVQSGAESNDLVCKCFQCAPFILTVRTVDAPESFRIVTCEHLKNG